MVTLWMVDKLVPGKNVTLNGSEEYVVSSSPVKMKSKTSAKKGRHPRVVSFSPSAGERSNACHSTLHTTHSVNYVATSCTMAVFVQGSPLPPILYGVAELVSSCLVVSAIVTTTFSFGASSFNSALRRILSGPLSSSTAYSVRENIISAGAWTVNPLRLHLLHWQPSAWRVLAHQSVYGLWRRTVQATQPNGRWPRSYRPPVKLAGKSASTANTTTRCVYILWYLWKPRKRRTDRGSYEASRKHCPYPMPNNGKTGERCTAPKL